jgi:hypothetical protein
MQVKLKISLLLFLAVLFTGNQSNAQDEGQTGTEVQELNQQHPELNLNDDKTLLMDADVKASKTQPNAREAGTINLKGKSDGGTKPSSSEKTEEDPLSFNFLYFIIQKFKISDIVDD